MSEGIGWITHDTDKGEKVLSLRKERSVRYGQQEASEEIDPFCSPEEDVVFLAQRGELPPERARHGISYAVLQPT
jgi:hypothetical protein